ncbi:MAG TPA: hypothetical protein VF316_19000, partial [Polyangiaceae bacterium]
ALMRDKVGQQFEASVTAMVGSGCFVALDSPFVDVMIRYEDLGADRYELDESGLRAVGARSGDTVNLGDRMLVQITDVAMLRRTVYGKRILAEGAAPNRPERPGKRGQGHGDKEKGRGRNKGGAKPSRNGRPPGHTAGPARPGRPGRPGQKPQGSSDARVVQRKEKKFGKPGGGKKGGGGGKRR